MRNIVFALAALALLAGCDDSNDSEAPIGAVLAEVVLLNEIDGPGAFVRFGEAKSQCHYLGELNSAGFAAAVEKMQCPDGTQDVIVKDIQAYVLFDTSPVRAGMTFNLHDGVAPEAHPPKDGVLVAMANFLATLSQKFDRQN